MQFLRVETFCPFWYPKHREYFFILRDRVFDRKFCFQKYFTFKIFTSYKQIVLGGITHVFLLLNTPLSTLRFSFYLDSMQSVQKMFTIMLPFLMALNRIDISSWEISGRLSIDIQLTGEVEK